MCVENIHVFEPSIPDSTLVERAFSNLFLTCSLSLLHDGTLRKRKRERGRERDSSEAELLLITF